jgi:serine/threonine protein kinase
LHRDLKPGNLGLNEGGILKVFDLDVCRILPSEALQHPNKTYKFTRHIGSPRYMAPEVALGEEYNAKADVYAFGLICYEVLSLKKAYGDIFSRALEQRVFTEGIRPSMPQSWPAPVANLVERCWSTSLEKRPTMNQVLCQVRSTLDQMTGPSNAKDRSATQLHLEESGRTLLIESESENFVGPFQ